MWVIEIKDAALKTTKILVFFWHSPANGPGRLQKTQGFYFFFLDVAYIKSY